MEVSMRESYSYIVKLIATFDNGGQNFVNMVVAQSKRKACNWIRNYYKSLLNNPIYNRDYDCKLVEQGDGYVWYKQTDKRGEVVDIYIGIDVILNI